MADEYIKRGEALAECDWYANEFCEAEYAILPIRGAIRNIPAADVQPVRHGRWDVFGSDMPVRREMCSLCGYITNPWLAQVYNYCPNCGAKMDKEKE